MALTGVVDRHQVSAHLGALLTRAEELADRLRSAADTGDAAAAADARREAALVASLRLDGSPLEALPAADAPIDDADDELGTAPAGDGRGGSWFDALRAFDEVPDATLLAREARGVRAAAAADDLLDDLARAPLATLGELHRRLTRGLLAPDRAAHLRTSDQAVHDASVGRVIYYTVEPALLPTAADALDAWLRGPAQDLPPLVAAGVLHLEVLRLHPFEAANGRLARAASRLWLRRHGLDPAGLAVPELALADDALGYHEEVARTLRRRDATIWLERWAEAVVEGLRGSARVLGVLDDAPGPAATATGLEPEFTIADLRDRLGLADLPAAAAHLEVLLDAGVVRRVPGARGLRYRRVVGD
ncbi:Fic family protein [Egicoccus sp. AB-alg2]|uniref:Fic family protein n=1 Tax=Egicoccus sp. AB-alg2 TaxID=3242693 RepID=UPI00359EB6CD